MVKILLAAITTVCLLPSIVFACGPSSKCQIGDRHYYIAMPQGHDGKTPVGAIVFSHGYQGSGAGIMRNKTLRGVASNLGVALIGVKSVGQDWNLPYSPSNYTSDGSEEFQYFDAVIAHASQNFTIDTDRLMATGFSAGGMMTWNLICSRSNKFAAFAPMAGTFWLKIPENCNRPVTNVIHIHGKTDRTVPLGGRAIGRTHQGDVPTTIEMYKKFGKFKPKATKTTGNLTCETHINNQGKVLDYCLFPGRHNFSSNFVKFAWESFVAKGVL